MYIALISLYPQRITKFFIGKGTGRPRCGLLKYIVVNLLFKNKNYNVHIKCLCSISSEYIIFKRILTFFKQLEMSMSGNETKEVKYDKKKSVHLKFVNGEEFGLKYR